jgi:hypothetical protein
MAFIPLFSELISTGGYPPGRFVCGHGPLVVSLWGEIKSMYLHLVQYCGISYMNLLFVLGDDRYLHVWYYPVVCRAHPRCLGASCCVICSFCLRCVRLVSYCKSLWWPMYEWCTGVCYSVVLCLCCLVLISCTITSTFTAHCLLALCMVTIGNHLSLV